jgi:hypothetical protein|tara:strand:- start:254 stop:529 length:276 start_codon:yes stop_codon:yes gene_type:complete
MSQRRFAIKRDLNLLRQRCEAQLITVYEGGMFRCDEHMVSYSQTIQPGDVVMDINHTPVKIADPEKFVHAILQQHRMVMNEYAEEYKKIVQ